jgi:hypothetical protein
MCVFHDYIKYLRRINLNGASFIVAYSCGGFSCDQVDLLLLCLWQDSTLCGGEQHRTKLHISCQPGSKKIRRG